MKRKILCVLLAALYLLAGFSLSAGAASIEHVVNGGFETIKADGKADGWGIRGTAGTDVIFSKAAAHDGEGGVQMKTQDSAVYVAQQLTTLVPGKSYVFSAWLKIAKMEGTGAEIKLEFKGSEKGLGSVRNRM